MAYLEVADPAMSAGIWIEVLQEFVKRGGLSTQERKQWAVKDHASDLIRRKKLIETTSADFLAVLETIERRRPDSNRCMGLLQIA